MFYHNGVAYPHSPAAECITRMRGKAQLMAAQVRWIKTLVQISPFVKKLLAKDPYHPQRALASVCHSLIIVKFSAEITVYHPRHERPIFSLQCRLICYKVH